jgi:hypothetical protein
LAATTAGVADRPAAFRLSRESATLLVVAYLIGLVMLMTAGIYDGPLAEPALLLVGACLALLVHQFGRMLAGKPPRPIQSTRWSLLLVVAALTLFSAATFVDRRLLIDSNEQSVVIRAIQVVEIALLASYLPGVWRGTPESPRWKTIRFALFAVFLVAGGVSVLHLSPTPHIDVWTVQDLSAKALLRGGNPYVDVHVEMTTPEKPIMSLPYPPTACYLNAIAYLLGKDVRWGSLAAMLVTGVSLRILARRGASLGDLRPALVDDAPALLLWLTPKTFFFLEQAWNDAYPLMFAALALVAHARGKRGTAALLLGLALSSKQTTVWLAPLALLLGFNLLEWSGLVAVAAATVLPFVLADFFALKHWLFDMHANHPPETDTMSFMSFLSRHFGVVPRAWPGVVLAASCALLAVWRAPRTRYAFSMASTLAVLVFFFFNILMCMNYYFFIAGLALLAAATSIADETCEERRAPAAAWKEISRTA